MSKAPAASRNFIDRHTGETLFDIQLIHEDTALFSIHRYVPGYLDPFRKWVREIFGSPPPHIRPYYLVIDMSLKDPIPILSYEDCYALTYRTTDEKTLMRQATVFVMPPENESYSLYKALITRGEVHSTSVHRASSVDEAIDWISLHRIRNR